MPRPTAIDAANRFREQLATQEAASAERMATVYARIYANLQRDAASLAEEIALIDQPSRAKILKLARTQQLLEQVKIQVGRFGGVVEGELTVIQDAAVRQGIDDALALMTASLPPDLPPQLQRALVGSFTRLPVDAIEAATGMMAEDSPLRQRLQDKFGKWTAEQVERHLVDGIAAGMNPRRIAALLENNLQEGLGSGLTSALSTIRTAQIKSYQTANFATYRANSDVVKGWVWHAELGPRTCLSCIAMHGTIHSLDEVMNDHHNGRCMAIPQTITYADLGLDIPDVVTPTESGESWFNRQPESAQREMMGPKLFESWQKNRFEFSQLSQRYNDPVYGELLRQTPLSDLESGISDRTRVSKTDFTDGYKQTLAEIDGIQEAGEFYDGELQEAKDKLEMEREISEGLRDLGLSPSRMTEEDWSNAASSFQDKAFNELTYATEAQREAAGNRAVGRQFVESSERKIIQIGGQDAEQKWTGGSATAARKATQEINASTKSRAQEYMAGRLEEMGYTNAGNMSYEQQRRLLTKIGKSEEGDVSPRQRADALEIAYNPRAAKGMKLWEYYEISMVKAGQADNIQPPPDNRENYIPGYLTSKKKQQKEIIEEIEF